VAAREADAQAQGSLQARLSSCHGKLDGSCETVLEKHTANRVSSPNLVTHTMELAEAMLALHLHEVALSYCNAALQLKPTCVRALRLRGEAYHWLSNSEASKRDFAEAKRLQPGLEESAAGC